MAAGPLVAGAAGADITPARLDGLNAMGPDFTGIHDRLCARAVVIGDGVRQVAIVGVDLLEVGDTTALRDRIEREHGIPAGAILIAPTHSHNAPRAGRTPAGGLSRAASAESLAFTDEVFAALVDVVGAARAALRPARVGIARGTADVNINRDELIDGSWMLGRDEDGPSDKTLTVIAIRGQEGGSIATLLGYAVHPTIALGIPQLSADLAGATTSAVADVLGGEVLWLPGSLGDQAPRRSLEADRRAGADPSADDAFGLVAALAEPLAAEAIRLADNITTWTDAADVVGRESTLPCPPKRGTGLPPDMIQEQVEAVALRLTALTLGDIALLGVGGEVTTTAAAEILAASAAEHPLLVSIANERLGYLADEDAFDRGTFAARGCPITRGWVPRAAAQLASMVGA